MISSGGTQFNVWMVQNEQSWGICVCQGLWRGLPHGLPITLSPVHLPFTSAIETSNVYLLGQLDLKIGEAVKPGFVAHFVESFLANSHFISYAIFLLIRPVGDLKYSHLLFVLEGRVKGPKTTVKLMSIYIEDSIQSRK